MLSDEVIERVTERLVSRLEDLNLYVLKKIAKKLKEVKDLSPSDSHKLVQILEYGGDYDKIAKELAKITNINVKEIYQIFREASKKEYEFAEQFYKYREKKYIPFDENLTLQSQVDAIAKQTAEKYANFSNTRGIGFSIRDKDNKVIFKSLDTTYKESIDRAVLSVSQGKSSLDEEIYSIIKELGSSGLKYMDYESGHSRRMDSSLRMAIKDGLRQLSIENQLRFGKEFEADGVEVTVHLHPAPDHAEVQGRQFTINQYDESGHLIKEGEFEKFQNDTDCVDITGKKFPAEHDGHDRRSIGQYNCYHSIKSIIIGINKPQYSDEELQKIIDDNGSGFMFEDKHYTLYEGEQLQRQIETEIRRQKDILISAQESGSDKLVQESQKRINQLTNKYYELSQASGLPTKLERLRVDGYKPVKVNDSIKEKAKKIEYKVLSESDFNKMESHTKSVYNDSSDEEKSAINRYTIDGFYDVNNYLYSKDEKIEWIGHNNVEEVKRDIKDIDSIMSRSKLDEDIIVYKGTSTRFFAEDLKNNKSEIPIPMYMSTSGNEGIAKRFLKKYQVREIGWHPALLEIRVPKGTEGIYLADLFNENGMNEYEILLNRDLKYKVKEYNLVKEEVDAVNKYGMETGKKSELEYVKIILEVIKNGK